MAGWLRRADSIHTLDEWRGMEGRRRKKYTISIRGHLPRTVGLPALTRSNHDKMKTQG
jgi:hypothetical protein